MNKSNIVFHAVQKLLKLNLDGDTHVNEFIVYFKKLIQLLSKGAPEFAENKGFLSAFLLVAIQDETYPLVRYEIMNHPDKSLSDNFNSLHNRESAMELLDDSRLSGDGLVKACRGAAASHFLSRFNSS